MSKLSLPLTNVAKGVKASIPAVGYGCWKVPKETAAGLIESVIKTGYRHLDCAADYGNEKEVGAGIKAALDGGVCTRADLHVTTKLWCTYHHKENVEAACRKSLADLGLDYIDLYLIHFPIALKYVPIETRYPPEWFYDPDAKDPKLELAEVPYQETWRAMEDLVRKGLVKSIGISNIGTHGIRDVWNYAEIKPTALQIELHPYLQQANLVRYAQSLGIHVTAYSPLGNGTSYWNEAVSTLKEEAVIKIAEKHGVSPGQVVLRWGFQRGCSIIPKSENEGRIKQNLTLDNFTLDEDDMNAVAGIDKKMRFNDPAVYTEKAFNTFVPIFD